MATLARPIADAAAAATPAPATSDALLPVYRRAPMEMVDGEGCTLRDADGRAYLDFTSGIAVNALGYGDAGLRDCVRAHPCRHR